MNKRLLNLQELMRELQMVENIFKYHICVHMTVKGVLQIILTKRRATRRLIPNRVSSRSGMEKAKEMVSVSSMAGRVTRKKSVQNT